MTQFTDEKLRVEDGKRHGRLASVDKDPAIYAGAMISIDETQWLTAIRE